MKKLNLNFKARWLLLPLVLITIGVNRVWADPTLLFQETFGVGNGSSARAWDMSYADQSGVLAVYSGVSSYTVTNAKQTKNNTNAALNTTANNTEATFIVGPLDVSSYESLSVTFDWSAGTTAGQTYYSKLWYATSDGGSYTEITKTSGTNTTSLSEQSFTSIPVAAQVNTLYLKVTWKAQNTNSMIDNFRLYGIEPSKSLVSIAKKTDASKIKYIAGEKFNPAGLVITATYDDTSTEDIAYTGNEDKFSFSPTTSTALTTLNTSVTVTYGGQTCSQSINVYAITLQAKDQDGNAIPGGGPGAPSFNGDNSRVTAAANAANYVFMEWVVTNATASTTTASPSTLSNPTEAVTVTAKYYKPISVTWKVKGTAWTPATLGTASVGYNTAWSELTLPTDPTTGDGCGQKFMGWISGTIATPLVKGTDDAAISALNLLTSANKSGKTTKITTTTEFNAVFADYAE